MTHLRQQDRCASRRASLRACLAAALSLILAWSTGPAAAPAADAARERGLLLGVGDIVTVSVLGQPELTTTVDVGGDGKIGVPLAGRIAVKGLTPATAAKKVAAALRERDIVVDPQVSIAVAESRSQQVSVLGEVRTPGRYGIGAQLTVLDALALAGGVAESAGPVAYLLRRDGDRTSRFSIDLEQLARRGTTANASLDLRAGDTLMVPRVEQFYIYGEVKTPNAYPLKPGTTVMQALSLAGGLTERGSDKRVEIRRRDRDGELRRIPGELGAAVRPDDILYVKERLF